MIATRPLLPPRRALPLVEAMGSFPPSRSESVSTIRSLTLRFRCAARAASLSFSSGGMRRSTEPLFPGSLPARPGAALSGLLARAAARVERDGEAGGEDADGDVVEALAAAPNLIREKPL